MSVLWLKSGYTVKYSLSPRKIPRSPLSGFPMCSGYISLFIPPLIILQIQYIAAVFLLNFQVHFFIFIFFSSYVVFPSVLLLDFQLDFVIISCKHLCLISANIYAVCLDKINLFLPERGKQLTFVLQCFNRGLTVQRSSVFSSLECTEVGKQTGLVLGSTKKTVQRTSVIIYRDNVWKKYLYPQATQPLSNIFSQVVPTKKSLPIFFFK